MIRTEVLRDIHFEEELWLERNGYAAFDDQTMFCKLLRNDYRTCVVSDATYIHNDAKASTRELKSGIFYQHCFNRQVFWQRYIFEFANTPIERVWCRICFFYSEMMLKCYDRILLKSGRINKDAIEDKKRAKSDAYLFVKSDAYKELPPVVQE